ncbi:hypothetical protein HNP69_002198 [Chryseobacterium koreense]|nr:hypothetical protein [Chryseobacterium koreense]
MFTNFMLYEVSIKHTMWFKKCSSSTQIFYEKGCNVGQPKEQFDV